MQQNPGSQQPFQRKLISHAIAFAILGSPMLAQAQNNPGVLEEVQVLGIRGSLAQALDVKRQADSIVDAISSEDIGKFPDKNVADSLQRIPGISVDRIWGEGRDIFVRGTDSTLNRTLMNGQNVASAYWWANDNPSRGFNYSILASELVSSLQVYKSLEAQHDEGSIGGMVNVITRRPMDLEPMTINLSAEYQYSELPDKWDPQLSGLVSWKNTNETFALLASYNRQVRTVRRDGLEVFPTNDLYSVTDADTGEVTDNVYVPWGGGSAIFQQDRERQTANVTLQFRPTDQWDMVLNYVRSDMDMDNSNQNYLFVAGGYLIPGGEDVIDPVFIPTSDGNQLLVGGTIESNGSIGVADEPIVRESFVESDLLDLDVNYEGDGWQLHGQLGHTKAEGGSTHDRNYWFEGVSGEVLNFGPNTNEFSFPDVDPLDGSAIHLNAANLRDWVRIMEDEESYAQVDFTLDTDWGVIESVKTGLKYRDHQIENNRDVGTVDADSPQVAVLNAITLADVSSGPSPGLHGEAATAGSLTQYAFMDVGLAREKIDSILNDGAMTYAEDQLAFYRINEDILAGYVQANISVNQLRGNFGVRVVETDQQSDAYIDGEPGSVSRSYREALPSLNLVYNLTEDIILRGAASRAMARPTFQNLSSNIVINATSGSATAGNPYLDPVIATQFEIGTEWYFTETSLLGATYFSKDLSTFVFNDTRSEIIDGESLNVTRPYNAPDGADIQGLELQWQQDLGLGFGAQANYTWTDADVPANADGTQLELPGNSEDQFNASVYYEDNSVSVRLSYNLRSESFGGLTSGSQLVTDKYDQWDASANWDVTDQFNLFMTAVNITNEVIYQRTSDGLPVGFYENGPRYSLGLRYRF